MINYTPLLNSFPLKAAFKVNKVSIKLDNCLPTGSFKDRAMIALCKDLKAKGATKLIGSSGGNAGVACSYGASATGLSATIFVPDSTRPMMINRMKEYGANVVPGGETWSEADQAARAAVAVDPTAEYAPPFDHPSIWVGNSTVVDEIYEQRNGVAPDVIICSVGGGGLLGGILLGLDRKGGAWKKCKVVAVETLGSASFFDSWKEGKVVTLNKIDTIAHSLGAKRVAEGVFNMAKKHPGGVFPIVVSDREAIDAVTFFLNEHRILVEAACGVSVAAGLKLGELLNLTENEVVNLDVVVEICGGSCMNSELLENYQKTARSSL